MFTIQKVNRIQSSSVESLGSKRKFWFYDGDQRMLFKAEERGIGEDWAEVVAGQLCSILGLPHVEYQLADEFDGKTRIGPGVVCKNIAPPPTNLVLGNELLLDQDPNYPSTVRRRVREHTVDAIANILSRIQPPSESWPQVRTLPVLSALDVFAGYLMLDAWIANQDRHHENWGAIQDGSLRLAPTFDHGAALARNIDDNVRKLRLSTRDAGYTVESFAKKARSALYDNAGSLRPLSTLDAFLQFGRHARRGTRFWLDQLEGLTEARIRAILEDVPNHRMSNVCKDFTLVLLRCNRQRLLKVGKK